jgi:hypothetical protein
MKRNKHKAMKPMQRLPYQDEKYWEMILNSETVLYVKAMADKEMGDESEDYEKIAEFFEYLKTRTSYKSVVILATQWVKYDEQKQVALAIGMTSELHASRFIMLMDYLAYRFAKGDLM